MTDNKLSVPIQDTERDHFVCSGTNREKMATRLHCRGWVTSQACQTYLWLYTVYTYTHINWEHLHTGCGGFKQTRPSWSLCVLFLCHCLFSWDTIITSQHCVMWLAEGNTKGSSLISSRLDLISFSVISNSHRLIHSKSKTLQIFSLYFGYDTQGSEIEHKCEAFSQGYVQTDKSNIYRSMLSIAVCVGGNGICIANMDLRTKVNRSADPSEETLVTLVTIVTRGGLLIGP